MAYQDFAGKRRPSSIAYPEKSSGYVTVDDPATGTGKFQIDNLIGSVAPIFDTTVDYTAGQSVMYLGKLYTFKANHPAGSWDASHVDATILTKIVGNYIHLQNGSVGNYANTNQVVTWNIIPLDGNVDFVKIVSTKAPPSGYRFIYSVVCFQTNNGIVPSNYPGAANPRNQIATDSYVGEYDIPDDYNQGIGFSVYAEEIANPSHKISIQSDPEYKDCFRLLKCTRDLLLDQTNNVLDTLISKQTLSNGNTGNYGNSTDIVSYNIIPIDGKIEFVKIVSNVPAPSGYHYVYSFVGFKTNSGIVPSNAPGATYPRENVATNVPESNFAIPNDYNQGIGFSVRAVKDDDPNTNYNLQSETYKSAFTLIKGIRDQKTSVLEGELNAVEVSLDTSVVNPSLSNGSVGNYANTNQVVTNNAIPINGNVGYIQILPSVEPPSGYVFKYSVRSFDVDSGIVPSNKTGAISSDHRKEIAYETQNNTFVIPSNFNKSFGFSVLAETAESPYSTYSLQSDPKYKTAFRVRLCVSDPSKISDEGAYSRIKDKIAVSNSACRRSKTANDSKDFQILICTDVHADVVAETNAVEIGNKLDSVDIIANLGDEMASYYNIANSSSQAYNWQDRLAQATKPYYFVIGNHEAGTFNYVQYCPTSQMMYDSFIKPIVDKGLLEAGEYESGKCYYYHDFTSQKIRLIVINEYDSPMTLDTTYWTPIAYDGSLSNIAWSHSYTVGDKVNVPGYTGYSFQCAQNLTTPSSIYDGDISTLPKYTLTPGYRYIRKTQADWFLATLASTPQDYAVIVATHNPFSDLAIAQVDKKFCQSNMTGETGAQHSQNNMSTDFIADAVNAFMNKSAYSATVMMTNGDSYSVSQDFSGVASGVKFLCYLGGHAHRDIIWRHQTYTSQWQVAPICANTTNYMQTVNADIRRTTYDGYDKDSLTSVSFNVSERSISLVKLGVDITENMEARDYEKINLE